MAAARPVLPQTWRALGNVIASLAAAAAFAAVLLGALAAGLAWLAALTLRLLVFGLGVALRPLWRAVRRDGGPAQPGARHPSVRP